MWAQRGLSSISGTAVGQNNLLHILVSALSCKQNEDTLTSTLQSDGKLSVTKIYSCGD